MLSEAKVLSPLLSPADLQGEYSQNPIPSCETELSEGEIMQPASRRAWTQMGKENSLTVWDLGHWNE